MFGERESDERREGEELERDDTPESVESAIEGHGPEGRGGNEGTPKIGEQGEHGQTQVSGDPGEPPDEE